jgi:hypothetical protein
MKLIQLGNTIFNLAQIASAIYSEPDEDSVDADRTLTIYFSGTQKPCSYFGDEADAAWRLLTAHALSILPHRKVRSAGETSVKSIGYVAGYPFVSNLQQKENE